MKTSTQIGLYFWRVISLVILYWTLQSPLLHRLFGVMILHAVVSSWLAYKSDDDWFWALLYGALYGPVTATYYASRWYMKSRYDIE